MLTKEHLWDTDAVTCGPPGATLWLKDVIMTGRVICLEGDGGRKGP
jgi:hypothetical protein